MTRRMLAAMMFGAGLLALAGAANSQPPGGKGEGKGGKGGPGGSGRFEVGTVLPKFVRSELKLTDDQEKAVAALEADVKEKLNKILTDDQKKALETIGQRGGPGGKGGPGGGPGGRGEGKGKGGPGGEKKPPMPPQ